MPARSEYLSIGAIVAAVAAGVAVLQASYAGGEKMGAIDQRVTTVEQAVVQQVDIQQRLNATVIDQAVTNERWNSIQQQQQTTDGLLREIMQRLPKP